MINALPNRSREPVTFDEACAILNVTPEYLREVLEMLKDATPYPTGDWSKIATWGNAT